LEPRFCPLAGVDLGLWQPPARTPSPAAPHQGATTRRQPQSTSPRGSWTGRAWPSTGAYSAPSLPLACSLRALWPTGERVRYVHQGQAPAVHGIRRAADHAPRLTAPVLVRLQREEYAMSGTGAVHIMPVNDVIEHESND